MKMFLRNIFVALCVLFLAAGAVLAQGGDINKAAAKFGQSLYYMNRLYLDPVDMDKMVETAILAMIEELDPHSSYISAKDLQAMNEPLQGEFEGIGIEFAIIKDTLTVQATVAGGPSEKVGLLAGDKIVQIDTLWVAGTGLTNDGVFKNLRGKKGSKVALKVFRRGVADTLYFNIVRDKIPLNSLDAAYMVEGKYLYLKLSRFALHSADEIKEAIANAEIVPEGIILDLRSNSGGYLPTAIDIADQFLAAGDLIVYTEGRSIPRMDEYATGRGLFTEGKVVVMIDENSASASEIVAGAIQDQDRGVVVGRRSFGKGLVQQALPLEDGSEIRLTIARYHTPSGRVIQSPYEKGHSDQYYIDFYERFARGESFSKDSIQFPDSLKFSTLKEGRTVYGGGGIMPDVFVARDTAAFSNYYSELLRQGLVIEYVNSACDVHRVEWLRKYPTFGKFDKSFKELDMMLEELLDLASSRGVERVDADLERSREDLLNYMKALTASSLYSRDCFYRVMNSRAPEYQAALEALEQ